MSPGATAREVTEAFRKFALRNHPDRGGDAERFRVGAEAYRRLMATARPDGTARSPAAAAHGYRADTGPLTGPRPDIVFHRRPRSGLTAMLRRARSTLARPRP